MIFDKKRHPGGRLLTRISIVRDIFLGAELDEPLDSLPIPEVVEQAASRYYPGYV